jgi:uncharacterized protein (TIGR02145 family)
MKTKILLLTGLVFLSIKNQAQTVTDYDGNVYNTVTIGTQVWMKENLKVTHYNNGDTISNITAQGVWDTLTSGAYCNYNNNSSFVNTYGRLYNWYAVNDTRFLCPTGWHVPTDAEWTTLTNYLGGEDIAGGKLKEKDTTHWESPNTGATNDYWFTALPGGYRNSHGTFYGVGHYGYWWSATENNATIAWVRDLDYDNSNVTRDNYNKVDGFSVRCIRD